MTKPTEPKQRAEITIQNKTKDTSIKKNQKDIFIKDFPIVANCFVTGYYDAELMLYDKMELNKTVYLINNKQNLTWKTTTTGYDIYYGPFLEQVITHISKEPKSPENYTLGYVADSILYKKINLNIVKDEFRYKNLINKAFPNSVFKLNDYGSNEYVKTTVSELKIDSICLLDFTDKEIYIVYYSYPEFPIGPRAIILNNKVIPFTGPCSYKELYVFQLNNRLYFETGSWCCNCGAGGNQVFEITKDSIVCLFEDGSRST